MSVGADRVLCVPAAKKSAAPAAVTPTRPKLLLIDGHSVAYRAFFALPVENFSTQTGQHTNGVFGFTSMLINVLRDEAPTHLAVAFDVSRKTFRSQLYVDYKANRSASPDEFKGQVDLVKEVLDALNVPHLGVEGFEADDVIATLATEAQEADYDVLICTGDRDAFQLVSERVTVLYPRKGVSDLARMTPAAVEERYFVAPDAFKVENYADDLAIVRFASRGQVIDGKQLWAALRLVMVWDAGDGRLKPSASSGAPTELIESIEGWTAW